ncbi:MAG: hypothetical protein Q6352_008045 [Candidatus Freyrarchaeum guaymaensis]
MIGVKEQENLLGPVFSARVIEYALRFLSGKIGGDPPESVENLDQLAEYLVSIADRYPTPQQCTHLHSGEGRKRPPGTNGSHQQVRRDRLPQKIR